MHRTDLIAIGELAARTGVAVSAIRFYEAKGLLAALRTGGGQRRFLRADIRRVSFILIAQQMGLSLDDIAAELARLPAGRNPNAADWARISTALRARIDTRIAALERTRDLLDGCIGCGCLSLKKCALYNRADKASQRGAGPRYLLGDRAGEIVERD
ncbi:MAG: redox-sensitive transcriptional activator SoxR [Sphingopyxis sp.]|uniref:redox-sensitive transcriptional activator SoxR n=1 Tax=Sphingopyxis sp. TaxID=1908224 RepID=UPI001A4CE7C2|nr:redox-sensitive transcriptional activator SoxR [Sphingopyxis sp.]MBL9069317.1 redox-sensitive transcriptional activator SoxR [Sphingopyxis sp.]